MEDFIRDSVEKSLENLKPVIFTGCAALKHLFFLDYPFTVRKPPNNSVKKYAIDITVPQLNQL
jgi:hypothetical protein